MLSADGSTVLSDADPEPWIPGAQYAQYSTRRGGGGGLQWRELSPVEGIRVMLYDSAFRTLKELEPNHPQLQSMSTSTWVPTFRDASRLNEAIARIKAGRGLSELEPHHNFPSQFRRLSTELSIFASTTSEARRTAYGAEQLERTMG